MNFRRFISRRREGNRRRLRRNGRGIAAEVDIDDLSVSLRRDARNGTLRSDIRSLLAFFRLWPRRRIISA
jgi:hypothetical protein